MKSTNYLPAEIVASQSTKRRFAETPRFSLGAIGLVRNFTLIVLTLVPVLAFSADTVWYLPPKPSGAQSDWLPRPLRKLTGSILGFSNREIDIETLDRGAGVGKKQSVPYDRAVWISPDWSKEGDGIAKAFAHFDAGRYAEAIPVMRAYVKTSKVAWRQQIAYGQLMQAAYRTGNARAALLIAIGFHDSSPPDCFYSLLPIAWTNLDRNASRDETALGGIAHENPVVRLIAASWLLGGSQRQRADMTLQNLSNDATIPLIARLADAVRWRTVAGNDVTRSVKRWEQKLDNLSPALQAGPMTTIADRLEVSGKGGEALTWWLAVAQLGKQCGGLAEHATIRATKLLENAKASE